MDINLLYSCECCTTELLSVSGLGQAARTDAGAAPGVPPNLAVAHAPSVAPRAAPPSTKAGTPREDRDPTARPQTASDGPRQHLISFYISSTSSRSVFFGIFKKLSPFFLENIS